MHAASDIRKVWHWLLYWQLLVHRKRSSTVVRNQDDKNCPNQRSFSVLIPLTWRPRDPYMRGHQCAYTTKPRDPYSAIRIAWLSGISTLTRSRWSVHRIIQLCNCSIVKPFWPEHLTMSWLGGAGPLQDSWSQSLQKKWLMFDHELWLLCFLVCVRLLCSSVFLISEIGFHIP